MNRMTSEETEQLRQRVQDEKCAQFMTMATHMPNFNWKIHDDYLIVSQAEVCVWNFDSFCRNVTESGGMANSTSVRIVEKF